MRPNRARWSSLRRIAPFPLTIVGESGDNAGGVPTEMHRYFRTGQASLVINASEPANKKYKRGGGEKKKGEKRGRTQLWPENRARCQYFNKRLSHYQKIPERKVKRHRPQSYLSSRRQKRIKRQRSNSFAMPGARGSHRGAMKQPSPVARML